jgi:hypothetical protein
MIIVFLGIGLVLLAVGITCYIKWPSYYKRSDAQDCVIAGCNITGGVLAICSLCVILALAITLSGRQVIDDKIAMYYDENTKIENQISTIVKEYQNYETEIFADIKPEESVALVSLYPELKSNTLVQKQIEIYTENNQKIKELKEQKLDYKPIAWWLYFGK